MKQFYYLITFLFFTVLTSSAQEQDYTAQVDYYFQQLDKSQIPTGILYERVFPAADVGRFSNTIIDTTSAFHFLTAFDELQTADYTGRWQPASTIIDNLSAKPHWEVPVGAINIDYNTIDEQALEDGLLDITLYQGDTLLVDVPNRPRSPYLLQTATLVSPLKMQTNSLSPGFYWEVTRQNSQTGITKLEVNFNLGNGWQNLSSVITPTFPNYGVYYIDFKLTLSNGTQHKTGRALRFPQKAILPQSTKKYRIFQPEIAWSIRANSMPAEASRAMTKPRPIMGKGNMKYSKVVLV